MRLIKFRAWNDRKKTFVFGPRDNEVNASWILAMCSANEMQPDRYTGLKDMNGDEIYESDIVRYKNSVENGIAIIKQDGTTQNLTFKWVKQSTNKPSTSDSIIYFQCPDELEIIGNIYENTKLLG